MNRPSLRDYVRKAGHPVLCLGPMSRHCVDAVIAYANQVRRPVPLIASRRQIECVPLGGGYVNNWDTHTFADYVRRGDAGGYVPLCRDHGGPWQGSNEASLPFDEALARSKQSIAEDIAAGFDVIHLDPSVETEHSPKDVVETLFDLYSFVAERAGEAGRLIEIEIGAEQQSGGISDTHELVALLKAVTQHCERTGLQKPLFCVVQTGTLVREMKNVGFTEGRRNESYDQKYAVESMEKNIRHLVDLAYINGVFVKEHNGDYLSDGSMSLRHTLGVGGVNVAPELGVFETKLLVHACVTCGLATDLDAMLQLFYESKKWLKWLRIDSQASDFDKAIMCGHYSFASPEFQLIRNRIASAAARRNLDLDSYITTSLIAHIQRMAWNLGYYKALA